MPFQAELYTSGEFSDVLLCIRGAGYELRRNLHRLVLSRSPWFRAMFLRWDRRTEVELDFTSEPSMTREALLTCLRRLYGPVPLPPDFSGVSALLGPALYLQVEDLIEEIVADVAGRLERARPAECGSTLAAVAELAARYDVDALTQARAGLS
eukprot:tig00020964_g16800.t1